MYINIFFFQIYYTQIQYTIHALIEYIKYIIISLLNIEEANKSIKIIYSDFTTVHGAPEKLNVEKALNPSH